MLATMAEARRVKATVIQLCQIDLLEYMNEHEMQKAALIGHSMGGKTVMTFAEKHPERVTKLIIADIAPRAYLASSRSHF